MTYEHNTGDIIQYGRMDIDDESCYMLFSAPKVYPHLTFTLGTESYAIKDSLKSDKRPYDLMKIEDPGYYTFFISIADSLRSGTCQTILGTN